VLGPSHADDAPGSRYTCTDPPCAVTSSETDSSDAHGHCQNSQWPAGMAQALKSGRTQSLPVATRTRVHSVRTFGIVRMAGIAFK